MKKGLLVCLLILACFAVEAQKECIVRGKIKDVEDGIPIRIYRMSGRLFNVVASDTIREGEFYFKFPVAQDKSELFYLFCMAQGFPNAWLEVWAAPGKNVKITGKGKLYGCWKVKSNVAEQKIANHYTDVTSQLIKQLQQLLVKRDEIYEQRQKMTEKKKKETRPLLDKVMKQEDSLRILIAGKELEVMQKTPVEDMWLIKMEELSRMCQYMEGKFPYRQEMLSLYNRLTEEQKQSERGKNITVFLFPPVTVKVGDQMADADLFDLQGNVHHLSDYLGKFILLDFWSRGCGPCMMALPEMGKFAAAHQDQLTVISLSSDDKKNWQEVSAEEKITWENLNDLQGEHGLYAKYNVSGIPYYVFISPQGTVLHTWSGYGKGIFTRNLTRFLKRADYKMSVTEADGLKIVEYPTVKPGGTPVLAIDKVVLSDTATVLYVKIYYQPHYWIKVAKEIHLVADDGTVSKLIGTQGITPDKQLVMPDSGEAEFVLTFEPLPAKAKSFDLIEGDCKGCYKLFGIALE